MEREQLIKHGTLILANFDFEKVYAFMKLSKWQWCNVSTGEYYLPSIEQLKTEAEIIIANVINDKKESTAHGTGGFYCYKFDFGLKLTFEPFSYSGY